VGSTPLPAALCRRIAAGRAGRVLDALEPAALLALLAVCTAFLVSGSANPFLYFRF
jgi:alginate O-acetyltransferase complex protein AlgI